MKTSYTNSKYVKKYNEFVGKLIKINDDTFGLYHDCNNFLDYYLDFSNLTIETYRTGNEIEYGNFVGVIIQDYEVKFHTNNIEHIEYTYIIFKILYKNKLYWRVLNEDCQIL